jgi:hypothetical protein
MSAALVRELRDNCAYLEDAGIHQTAQLMVLAADELVRLSALVDESDSERPDAIHLHFVLFDLGRRLRLTHR